jgi:L-alanine-DL-glutamate epimerase-like enolase superfamily enzyme
MSYPILSARIESWPYASAFTISRGTATETVVVVAEVVQGQYRGRGECTPYARYGETPEGVASAIAAMAPAVANGLDREGLQQAMKPGAARCAIDCAFWDLAAKSAGTSAYALAGLPAPKALLTCYTLSLATPGEMAEQAARHADRALLKVKLGRDGDPERIMAVRRAAPNARLIVDANEGWSPNNLGENLAACSDAGVQLVEQPLPAAQDDALARISRPLTICADESAHACPSLAALVGKYDAINVKLDKAGGLTEALAMAREAERLGFSLMVGCMVATSLSMAPAMLVAQNALFVDLDGPLVLERDRPEGLHYEGSMVHPANPDLWG